MKDLEEKWVNGTECYLLDEQCEVRFKISHSEGAFRMYEHGTGIIFGLSNRLKHLYQRANTFHWKAHAERLAKELADVKAEKQEGQSPPRYKAGDRVECQLFRCDDWYKCTVKKLIEESQTDGRYEYRVVRDNDRITYYASESMMRPLPVPTFRPGDKVRLKGDVNYKAWEITGGIDKGMYPVVAVSGYVAKGWFSAHDIILVEAAK